MVRIEWINIKVLRYSIGKYIHSPVIDHHGKEYEKEYMYIYIIHVYIYI